MKKIILSLAAVGTLLFPATSFAQNSFWDSASKALNSDAGKQALESLTKTQTVNTNTTMTKAQAAAAKAAAGGNFTNASAIKLPETQVSAGLKDALKVGTQAVVKRLGKEGGFNLDPAIRIPLPGPIARADSALKTFGMGSLTADLETRMNRAAELAAPKAGALFVSAIQKMTVTDAQAILTGPQDSATQYLRKAMGPQLAKEIQPIIAQSLSEAGAVKAYDAVTSSYAKLPLAASLKTNMNDYVTNKALDGIFYYVAQEEAAIRANPAKRSTDLLKSVFGSVIN